MAVTPVSGGEARERDPNNFIDSITIQALLGDTDSTIADLSRLPIEDQWAIIEATSVFGAEGDLRRFCAEEIKTNHLSSEVVASGLAQEEKPLAYLLVAAARFGGERFSPPKSSNGRVLHETVAAAVKKRHHVDIPRVKRTRIDEDSLCAWSLSWALERVQQRSQEIRGDYWKMGSIRSLAQRLAGQLRVVPNAIGTSGKEVRLDKDTPGIELLRLKTKLYLRADPLDAIAAFTAETAEQEKRHQAAGRRASGENLQPIESPLRGTQLERISRSRAMYAYDLDLSYRDFNGFIGEINNAIEKIEAGPESAEFHEKLVRLTAIAHERWMIGKIRGEHEAQFEHVFTSIVEHYSHHITSYVYSQSEAIASGGASMGILKLALEMVDHPELWPFRLNGQKQERLKEALVDAACIWHGQPNPQSSSTQKIEHKHVQADGEYTVDFSTNRSLAQLPPVTQKKYLVLARVFIDQITPRPADEWERHFLGKQRSITLLHGVDRQTKRRFRRELPPEVIGHLDRAHCW